MNSDTRDDPADSDPAPAGLVRWRAGRVVALGRSWDGAQELRVDVADPVGAADGHSSSVDGSAVEVTALAYPALVGTPRVGDRVLLNTSALARGLGTGGYALVVAMPDRLPPDPPAGPGHLVKGPYTPLQAMVIGVDVQESEHHPE
jgi:hypothetical protein